LSENYITLGLLLAMFVLEQIIKKRIGQGTIHDLDFEV
jgi:hypothetical protein